MFNSYESEELGHLTNHPTPDYQKRGHLLGRKYKLNVKDTEEFEKLREKTDRSHRGNWNNRWEFLLSCIGFSVGFGNFWRFPIRVYESGSGGSFLIPYFIFLIILATPLVVLEMGIGQFSGLSPSKAFICVPLLSGIGWCMVIISGVVLVYYSIIVAWAYQYLFGSFIYTMAWSKCNNTFNTLLCIDPFVNISLLNDTQNYVTSTQEFWDYFITGYRHPNGDNYSVIENPGLPKWSTVLSLLLCWIILSVIVSFGLKISGKIMYFFVFYPYFILIGLLICGAYLPGAMAGIKLYISPNFLKMISPLNLLSVIDQLSFSIGFGFGCLINYSSYNSFNDNILHDAIIIITVDSLTSVMAGLGVFEVLGYMAYKTGKPIDQVISNGFGLFFVTYPDVISSLPGSNSWNFLFMLMTVSLGLDSQIAMLNTITTAIYDSNSKIKQKPIYKVILIISLSCILFLIGIILTTPAGVVYMTIIDSRTTAYGLPILTLFECIIIGIFYGIRTFKSDLEMMFQFDISLFWVIMIGYVDPFLILLIIIFNIINYKPLVYDGQLLPKLVDIASFVILILTLLPIVIEAIRWSYRIKSNNPNMNFVDVVKKTLEPPIYWGPYYKINWLLSEKYTMQLLKYKSDSLFLKQIDAKENIDEIIQQINGNDYYYDV